MGIVSLFHACAQISNSNRSGKIDQFESAQERRSAIKRLCYGFLYGQGLERMSNQMKRSNKETFQLVNAFKKQYPAVIDYQSKIHNDCRQTGGSNNAEIFFFLNSIPQRCEPSSGGGGSYQTSNHHSKRSLRKQNGKPSTRPSKFVLFSPFQVIPDGFSGGNSLRSYEKSNGSPSSSFD